MFVFCFPNTLSDFPLHRYLDTYLLTTRTLYASSQKSCRSLPASRSQTVSQAPAAAYCVVKACSFVSVLPSSTYLVTLQGRQHLGALFNFVAYYIIALPLGIALAFLPQAHMGLQGLWIGYSNLFWSSSYYATLTHPFPGQVVALFIVGIGEYAVVWLGTDWEKEVVKSIERNEQDVVRRAMVED